MQHDNTAKHLVGTTNLAGNPRIEATERLGRIVLVMIVEAGAADGTIDLSVNVLYVHFAIDVSVLGDLPVIIRIVPQLMRDHGVVYLSPIRTPHVIPDVRVIGLDLLEDLQNLWMVMEQADRLVPRGTGQRHTQGKRLHRG